MAMEFAMTTIVVDEYARAIDYYTKILGFTLTEDTVLSPDKRWVTVRPGTQGASILLAKAATAEQSSRIGNQTGGSRWLLLTHRYFRCRLCAYEGSGRSFYRPTAH